MYYVLDDSEELKVKLQSNNTIYLYFYKKSCTACNSFKKILNRLIENRGLTIYAIDIENDEFEYFEFITDFNLSKTPSLLCIKNNNEIDRCEGYIDEDELNNFFDNMEKIDE